MVLVHSKRALLSTAFGLGVMIASVAPAQALTCNASTNPNGDWQKALDDLPSGTAASVQTLCFAGGLYSGQLHVSGKHNIQLVALAGETPSFVHDDQHTIRVENSSSVTIDGLEVVLDREIPSSFADSTYDEALQVTNSQSVSLRNMTISNLSLNPDPVVHKIDRALVVRTTVPTNRSSVEIVGGTIAGNGKQVLIADGADVTIQGTHVECYYFCVDAEGGATVSATDASFLLNHTQPPPANPTAKDDHAAVWATNSDMRFTNCSFTFITGRGFVAGVNEPTNHIDIDGGSIVHPEQMRTWISTNANYKNIVLNITGQFPASILPYECNIYHNPGCVSGRERGNADPGTKLSTRPSHDVAFQTIPLPPPNDLLMLFNTQMSGGAIVAQAFSQASPAFISTIYQTWSEIPAAAHGGWLEPNDRLLSGDFLGDGRGQLLFFNTDPDHIGGAIRLQKMHIDDVPGGAKYWFETVKWMEWSSFGSSYDGWLDANDRILAGDFLGRGRTQLLLFNVDQNQIAGAIRIQEFDLTSQTFVDLYRQDWSQIAPAAHGGWLEPNDRIVAGDFQGVGRSQLLFFNTDPDQVGGAIRMQTFDQASNGFVTIYWQNWSAIAPAAHGGWLEPNDRIIAGQFFGNGRAQLLFVNTDPDHVGGAIRIQDFDSASNTFLTKYWQNWSSTPSGMYGGWLDPSDLSLAIGNL